MMRRLHLIGRKLRPSRRAAADDHSPARGRQSDKATFGAGAAMGWLAAALLLLSYFSTTPAAEGNAMNNGPPDQVVTPPQFKIESAISSTFRAAYSPDGKSVAFIGSSLDDVSIIQICVYDTKSWNLLKVIPFSKGGWSITDAGISFSPDSAYLAFGVTQIFIWKISDWTLSRVIDGPYARGDYAAGNVQGLAFSPDGRGLAVLYSAMFWPPTAEVRTPERAGALEQAALLSRRSKKIPDFTRDAVVMAFDLSTGAMRFATKLSESPAGDSLSIGTSKISYASNGASIVASGRSLKPMGLGVPPDQDVFLATLNSDTGVYERFIHGIHADIATTFALDDVNNNVFTGTNTGTYNSIYNPSVAVYQNSLVSDDIRQWDMVRGRQVGHFGPIGGPIKGIYLSPDRKRLVACQNDLNSDATVRVWDAETSLNIKSYRINHDVRGRFLTCLMSPDGNTIVLPELHSVKLGGNVSPDIINVLDIR